MVPRYIHTHIIQTVIFCTLSRLHLHTHTHNHTNHIYMKILTHQKLFVFIAENKKMSHHSSGTENTHTHTHTEKCAENKYK